MIENLYLLIEIITMLLMLWALHGSKKRLGIYTIAYVCVALITETAVAEEMISVSYIVFIHFGLVLLNITEFKDSVKNAILYTFLNIIIIFILEYILGLMFILIGHVDFLDYDSLIILHVILFVIALFLYKVCNMDRLCNIFMNNNILAIIFMVIMGTLSIVYVIQFYEQGRMVWDMVVYVALFFSAIIFLMYEWQKENYQNKKKAAELEIFRRYDEVYKELILSMRKKQHDFDNHIQAIYSMNLTEEGIEAQIRRKNEYCQKLLEENQDSIFLREDMNPVFLGFLYTEKKKAEENGVKVDYCFDCRDIESHLSFMDFVTVMGNLFDNALEALENEEHKIINLRIEQKENSVYICMSNTYSYSKEEMPPDFLAGKSRKGEGHGLGLSNVSDIVKRYRGVMQNMFEERGQGKYYTISLQLFWNKE